MFRNVFYRRSDRFEDRFCGGVLGIQSTEGVGQLRQADRRMVAYATRQQRIDLHRRAPLKHIQIDAGIQEQRPSDCRFVRDPWKIFVGPALERPDVLLGL